jgi:hypothetical protein
MTKSIGIEELGTIGAELALSKLEILLLGRIKEIELERSRMPRWGSLGLRVVADTRRAELETAIRLLHEVKAGLPGA